MNKHNIPQDNKQAEIYLKGAKDELTSLYGDLTFIATVDSSVNPVLDNLKGRIEIIDSLLEGAEYEDAAKLDHMTENQFNV